MMSTKTKISRPTATARPPSIVVRVESVTSVFVVRQRLDLTEVARLCINAELRHNCVEIRLKKPRVTAHLFVKGSVNVMGASSEDDSRTGARRIARMLQRVGIQYVRFRRFRVVNINSTCRLPFAVSLEKFYRLYREKHPKDIEFFPELANYVKVTTEGAKLHIHSTGTVQIFSASTSAISSELRTIFPLLLGAKASTSAPTPTNPVIKRAKEDDSDDSDDEPDESKREDRRRILNEAVARFAQLGPDAFSSDEDDEENEAEDSRLLDKNANYVGYLDSDD